MATTYLANRRVCALYSLRLISPHLAFFSNAVASAITLCRRNIMHNNAAFHILFSLGNISSICNAFLAQARYAHCTRTTRLPPFSTAPPASPSAAAFFYQRRAPPPAAIPSAGVVLLTPGYTIVLLTPLAFLLPPGLPRISTTNSHFFTAYQTHRLLVFRNGRLRILTTGTELTPMLLVGYVAVGER